MSHPVPIHRRCWAEIKGHALRHNYRILRRLIAKQTRLLAVVKANAYGHGLLPIARELETLGIDWLGVANVAEGVVLRKAGISRPILLLSATLPEEMAEAVHHRLTLILSSPEEARHLDRRARQAGTRAEAHLKIDTGMGRLGVWHREAGGALEKIACLRGIALTGLCTHFASADNDPALTVRQWNLVQPFFAAHPGLLHHAANSPAVTRRYGFNAGLVRAGLALYGIAPNRADEGLGLRPVLDWKSRVTLVREVGQNRTISYGATYRVTQPERQAIVAMGYGDGYFRAHSNRGQLLVRGHACPIRGRVTMDQIVIDVSAVPACRVGDEVVALGAQAQGRIDAWNLAAQAATIPWEILTNIGARVPRFYHDFQSLGQVTRKTSSAASTSRPRA